MSIVAAIDFSSVSDHVAQSAAMWARRLGCPLHLIYVYAPPAVIPPASDQETPKSSVEITNDFTKQLDEMAQGLLSSAITFADDDQSTDDADSDSGESSDVEAKAQSKSELLLIHTTVLTGPPEDELLAFADKTDAQMLVMGTRGHGEALRLFLGSVAEQVVACATRPVMVVSADTELGDLNQLEVAAALSPGALGKAVAQWVQSLRDQFTCDVSFIHVFDPPGDSETDDPELLSVLRRELSPLVSISGQGKTELLLRSSTGKNPDPLTWEANQGEADVLVVGNRSGRHFFNIPGMASMKGSNIPVVFVPVPRGQPQTTDTKVTPIPGLRQILVTTDFSDASNQAIIHAYRILRSSGGCMYLFHASSQNDLEQDADAKVALEGRLLNLVPDEANTRGILSKPVVVGTDNPTAAILQAAESLGVDMIVTASHGASDVYESTFPDTVPPELGSEELDSQETDSQETDSAETALGAVAEALVRRSERPVVVVGQLVKQAA